MFMENFNYFRLGIVLVIVGLVLIIVNKNYQLIESALIGFDKTPIAKPTLPKTLSSTLDRSYKNRSINFKRPVSKAYIEFSETRPLNEKVFSSDSKYSSADATCSFWLKEYRKNNSGQNKVNFDKACNGFLLR